MSKPTVSVIIPTYNRAELLPRALDSVVAQTFEEWELVLVDDGSTDATNEIVARYAARLGDRFQYHQRPHVGCCAARNFGIDRSRGRFVAFLDSDDEFLPTKLERQLALFEARPDLGFVFSDCSYVDLHGVQHASVFESFTPAVRLLPHEAVVPGLRVCKNGLFDALLREYFICTIVGMVRREVLGEEIRFPRDPAYAEEWFFYLQVARGCRGGFVEEPLCRHHHVRGSVSRTDAHRNTMNLRNVLLAMLETFGDLPRPQRRIIHRHLAQAGRQLGYDHYRKGDYRRAARCFAESFRHAPRLRTLWDITDANLRRETETNSSGAIL